MRFSKNAKATQDSVAFVAPRPRFQGLILTGGGNVEYVLHVIQARFFIC